MKYAIISDIHGNTNAFKAALLDAKKRGCGKVVCLGDLTGYGDDSLGCVKLAMARLDVCLMGNHDSACCGKEDPFEVSMIRNYDEDVATRNLLGEEQMTWLRDRPYVWVGPGFACTHGEFSGPSGWGYITRPSDAWPSLWSRDEQVLFVGHTHVPLIMMMSAESARKMKSIDEAEANEGMRGLKVVNATACAIKPGARYVINVGSIGRPREGSKATYAVFDTVAKKVSLVALTKSNRARRDKCAFRKTARQRT